MSQKNLFCVLMVFVAMTVIFFAPFGANSASGAGGPIDNDELVIGNSPSLHGIAYLPDASLWYSCQNIDGTHVGDGDPVPYATGGVDICLKNHDVQNASWYFYTNDYDPSTFRMALGVNGMLLNGDDVRLDNPMNWRLDYTTREGVDLYELLRLDYQNQEGNESISVFGNFHLAPAEITNSYFTYEEYPQYGWLPEGGYGPTDDTRFQMECNFEGRFYGTPEEVLAMGMPFVQSAVPEPSTVVLLITALASAGFGILRKLWV